MPFAGQLANMRSRLKSLLYFRSSPTNIHSQLSTVLRFLSWKFPLRHSDDSRAAGAQRCKHYDDLHPCFSIEAVAGCGARWTMCLHDDVSASNPFALTLTEEGIRGRGDASLG
jgi:hypothetical protein